MIDKDEGLVAEGADPTHDDRYGTPPTGMRLPAYSGGYPMKRLILAAALSSLAALAACDDPRPSQDVETYEPPMEAPVAPPVEETPPPAVTPPPAPADNTALPPEARSSEESVQPESETLFY